MLMKASIDVRNMDRRRDSVSLLAGCCTMTHNDEWAIASGRRTQLAFYVSRGWWACTVEYCKCSYRAMVRGGRGESNTSRGREVSCKESTVQVLCRVESCDLAAMSGAEASMALWPPCTVTVVITLT